MEPPLLVAELARAGVKLKLTGEENIEVSAPKGRLSADLRARIARQKPELVEWLAAGGNGKPAAAGLPHVVHDPGALYEPFGPSDLQTSFLIGSRDGFEHFVRPHQYMEFDYDELDPRRFEEALNRVLRRHRKDVVIARDDLMLQVVRDPEPVRVPVTDLRDSGPGEARAGIERVRTAMERREPETGRWPWLDMHITRYGNGRARLHFNNNNLFSDAPSIFRLLDEVWRGYHHPAAEAPELEIGFRDCVLALAGLEDSPRGRDSEEYWRGRMADWPDAPAVPLAAGAERRTGQRSRLVRREMIFAPDTWRAIQRRAEAHGVSRSSALLAAHSELLGYWSGSRHFLINNMITHRVPLHPQIGEVLGNFASLYPLEVDWRHDEAFCDRARRLQVQVIADVEHAYWSGVKVLQALNQVRRTPGRAVCPFAVGSALFVGKAPQPVYSLLETPQVTFDCEFWDLPDGGLWVIWDVIETMFPDGLIDAMEQGYRSALKQLADSDESWQARALDLLPTAQRAQRAEVNRPAADVPPGLLHDSLPLRAAETPGKPAVVTDRAVLSYAELHRRAADVAGRLRESGVRPRDRVAVVLPKGWEQAAAVLGILTAGAAYAPFDPECPDERLRFLLADAGARAVLTNEELRDRLTTVTAAPVLDAAAPVLDAAAAPNAAVGAPSDHAHPRAAGDTRAAVSPSDPAYVIYTSGSTGRPKGVMLDHRGPLNTIADVNRRFGVGPGDVVFGVSSLCFDLSVYDIFGSLAAGATLVMPPAGQTDPASWLDLVAGHDVTVWNSVPAVMQLFVEAAAAAGRVFPSLRTVLLSGDWIPVPLPRRIRQVAPNARVISLGGATEASIWSIFFDIVDEDPSWPSIPYGRPLANQTWHVLDEHGRDAPAWVPGELYIGGTGLAMGYAGDPARTAAAFVSHPRTGERLYRTGDLGRYLPSGDIEFLGRTDFQVKIQGFRVEPGEVEHAILEHPQVAQAAVVACESGSGKQLVGYAVAAPESSRPDGRALREFLVSRLPAHLVPSRVVVLDRMPLTGNGKLDRRALETASPVPDRPARAFVGPRTPTEKLVGQAWEEVLSVSPIGVHDDFFDLGGQSFAALRVIRILAGRFASQLTLGALLEHRTVAGTAAWLDAADRGWSPLVRLAGAGQGTPWCFVHPAGGNVLCYRGLADLLAGSVSAPQVSGPVSAVPAPGPVYAVQAPGPLNGHQPLDRIEDLAELYLNALRQEVPHGPYRLGGWSSGAPVAFEMARQLRELGEPVERLAVIDCPAPVAARPARSADDIQLLLWFVEDLGTGFVPSRVSDDQVRRLVALPAAERLTAALDLARDQGAADPGVDPDSLEAALPVFRAMIRACDSYRASAEDAVSAPTTVVRAGRGVIGEFEGHPCAGSPDWGWASLTTGEVTAVSVPATHHTLLTSENVAAVAGAIGGRAPHPARQA